MAASAAAIAAVIRAIQASGVVVRVPVESFADVIARSRAPLVVHAQGGFFAQKHQYLTSYKGLAFTTRTSQPLNLPPDAEVVEANRIWTPG